MSVTVNTNVSAMTAQRYLTQATNAHNTAMERLSSGYRINSAKDDAAGLQISNRLTSQTRGLDVAVRNANDGISVAQTAEGAMKETTSILHRIRDLTIQSANGSNSDADRKAIQQEVTALNKEMNRVAETTSFGGNKLLNGTYGSKSFQIGANSGEAVRLSLDSMRTDTQHMGGIEYKAQSAKGKDWTVHKGADDLNIIIKGQNGQKDQTINIKAKEGDDVEELATYINGQTDKVSASVDGHGHLQLFTDSNKVQGPVEFSGGLANDLKMGKGEQKNVNSIDVTTVGGAQQATAVVDAALQYVASQRTSLGAFQNRFDHAISNLDNANENVVASRSRIKDTDFAKETTALTKAAILQKASTGILAQAKQSPATALSLLG